MTLSPFVKQQPLGDVSRLVAEPLLQAGSAPSPMTVAVTARRPCWSAPQSTSALGRHRRFALHPRRGRWIVRCGTFADCDFSLSR